MVKVRTILVAGAALLAAPAVIVIPATLAFVAVSVLGQWTPNASSVLMPANLFVLLGAVYVLVARVSAPAGAATWIGLQVTQKESAKSYALAGAAEAALWAALRGRPDATLKFASTGARLGMSVAGRDPTDVSNGICDRSC